MRFELMGASMVGRALRGIVGVTAAAVLLSAVPSAAQTIDAADEALKNGDIAEAKAQFEQAVKRNPADYNAALSYVSTLPAKDALRAADSMSRAANTPGWVKAACLRIIGDHSILKEDYKKAADAYFQASKTDSASAYRHLHALAIAMDGQTEAARVIWNEIALNKADKLSDEAARMLAQLPKPAVAPQPAAAVSPPVAAPANQTNTPPAQAAAPPVNPQPAAPINKPSDPPAQPPAASVNQPSNTPAKTPPPVNANTKPTVDRTPTETVFTIQVGAFATKENADNLVKRLTGKYDDITVTATANGDQTLYRVRVGSFKWKEEAAAFADRLIIEAGLSARVTEK